MYKIPNTEIYDMIKKHLGGKIPCYGEPGGCCVDDDTNSDYCGDECLLLRVYKAGFMDGVTDAS